jgi:hypothetical protein
MAKRSDPTKVRDENQKIAEDAASAYVKGQNYSESSLEAVRRAARANKRRARVRIGGYESDI